MNAPVTNFVGFIATRKVLTFSEFQAKFPDASENINPNNLGAVLVYEDQFWILRYEYQICSIFYLTIENHAYVKVELSELESVLFRWAHE
jgi:hypothetical protein